MTVYNLDTVITDGNEKGMTVAEALERDPKYVFNTIKRWAADKVSNKGFSDEVLEAAHVTKIVRDVTVQQEEFSVPRTVVMDENGKVRRKRKQDNDDNFKDEEFYYGPDYAEGAKDENQEWDDGFDAEEDRW